MIIDNEEKIFTPSQIVGFILKRMRELVLAKVD